MSNLRKKFTANALKHRTKFRRFLTKVENNPPKQLDMYAEVIDQEVWKETDCLACSNCCRTMSPTYTFKDLQRISKHLNMTIKQFKEKWLYLDKDGDWMNVNMPCQFLDLKTNMCSIYEVRPADCADFPHFHRRPATDYFYIHKQNIEYCPATMLMVEKIKERINS